MFGPSPCPARLDHGIQRFVVAGAFALLGDDDVGVRSIEVRDQIGDDLTIIATHRVPEGKLDRSILGSGKVDDAKEHDCHHTHQTKQ